MPISSVYGLRPGATVVATSHVATVGLSSSLLGRIIDGAGNPLDNKEKIDYTEHNNLTSAPINPLSRAVISEPLDVGVRAINSLLSVGRG